LRIEGNGSRRIVSQDHLNRQRLEKLNHAFFGLNREFYGSGFMPLFIPVLAAGKLRRI